MEHNGDSAPFVKMMVDEIIDLSGFYDSVKTSFKRYYHIMHPKIPELIPSMRKLLRKSKKTIKNFDELKISSIDRITFLFYYNLIQSVLESAYAAKIIGDAGFLKKLIEKFPNDYKINRKASEESIINQYAERTKRLLELSDEVTKKKNKIIRTVTSNDVINEIMEKNLKQLNEYENNAFQEISNIFIQN